MKTSDRARSKSAIVGGEVSAAIRSFGLSIFNWLDDNAIWAVIFVLGLNILAFVWLASLNQKFVWAYFLAGFNLGALFFCYFRFRVRRR